MIVLKDMQKLTSTQISALIGKIRAIVYTRVSSDMQIDNYSLESQIEICINEAKTKFDINKDEIIVLREEAESGDNPNRPMLNYILFLLDKGLGNKVIFLHPDRLSRHLHLQQQITHKIWELGCDLHFVEFDLQKGNAESMLNYNIQGSIAQYNKAKILANTKRGRRTMVANNKIPGMNRIYGYTYDKDLNTLVENELEKERYLIMVEMILEGATCSEIARHFSKKRYAAPKGDKWYQVTISRILRNPVFMGTFYYGKTEIAQAMGKKRKIPKPKEEWSKISVPQYIDETTYQRIQKCLDINIKSSKNNNSNIEYLLRGYARCGRCGASVSAGVTTRTKNGTLKYYSCTRKATKSFSVETGESNLTCRGTNWRTDMIDKRVWEELSKIIDNPKHLINKLLEKVSDAGKIEEMRKKRDNVNKTIKEKEKQKERYIDLYSEGIIKSKEDLSIKLNPVENEIEELQKEFLSINENLNMNQDQEDSAMLAASMVERYQKIIKNHLSLADKRKIMSVLIDKVILHEDKKIEIVYRLNIDNEQNYEENQTKIHTGVDSRQVGSRDIYVSDSLSIDKPKWGGETFTHKWSEIEHMYPRMLKMYNEDLLSFEQIAEATETDWWSIKQLFKAKGADILTTKERGIKRRARDFERIYDLHYVDGLAFTRIYKEHGLSPTYCKQVLQENIHQLKK